MEPLASGQIEVQRARIVDLLPLSWNTSLTLSRGKSPRNAWQKRLQAAITLPILVLLFLMYMPSGDVITSSSRDAVILLTEARSTKKTLQRFGSMVLVFLASLFAFMIWLLSLTLLGDTIGPWVGLLPPLWLVVGLVLLATSTGGSISALSQALIMVRPPEPYWVAQALASAPGARMSGLEFARTAIEDFVPAGVPVVVTAASERIAVVYERFGFVRQKPGGLNLIGRSPAHHL